MISGEKGQITVEAVLILGFFVLIFIGVTVPMTFEARNTALDTTIIADAKFATEQIASAANTVILNGSKRTIDVYVPGASAGSINISTTICNSTDGSAINTTVAITRSNFSESHAITSELKGGNWVLNSNGCIVENQGRRYSAVVEYKTINITLS
jgi:uncharacterized protein (UPF0333 family)